MIYNLAGAVVDEVEGVEVLPVPGHDHGTLGLRSFVTDVVGEDMQGLRPEEQGCANQKSKNIGPHSRFL
jgi:hypothetical protein